MEDRLTWADTVAPYALHNAEVDERILVMWGHLRKAVMFFMHFQPGQHTEEHIAQAQEDLFQYARLVQEAFDTSQLMTFQLHTVMAHAAEQARACGPTAYACEWWLERLMQVFKRVTKYRSTRYPECNGFNHITALNTLQHNVARHPGVTRLLDVVETGRCLQKEGRYDDTDGAEWLSGKLEDVTTDHATVRPAVQVVLSPCVVAHVVHGILPSRSGRSMAMCMPCCLNSP